MRRSFGAGDNSVTLWVDQAGSKPAYNLTLIGHALRHPYGSSLTVQFAPEREYTRYYIKAKSSKGRPVISLFGARLTPTETELALMAEDEKQRGEEVVDLDTGTITAIESAMTEERLAAITELKLGRALIKPLTLEIGSLAEPLAELQECANELTAEIAKNTAESFEVGTPPKPTETERWVPILQASYPKQLQYAEQEARVGVNLTIATSGKPTYCEVVDVVGLTAFNDTVCLVILKHATFRPARNADGELVVARYSTRVTFRLND